MKAIALLALLTISCGSQGTKPNADEAAIYRLVLERYAKTKPAATVQLAKHPESFEDLDLRD